MKQKILNILNDFAMKVDNHEEVITESSFEGLADELVKIVSPFEAPVMLNFANIQKEFEEKFCYSFMENGEKRINNIMWKSCDTANDVWEWFEQKLKEASKISA